jgi:hypothetical protein
LFRTVPQDKKDKKMEAYGMRTKLVTAVLVAATACGRPRVLTTMGAKTTTEFWCAQTGECVTDRERCAQLGECLRHLHAWCSQEDDGPRFVCAVSETRCSDLAMAAAQQFNNACLFQPKDGV